MIINRTLISCLIATLSTLAAFGQAESSTEAASANSPESASASSSSPIAYVYVARGNSGISAYTAASSGSLKSVSGSPFADREQYIAANGKFLFGVSNNYSNIDSFSIAPGGALKKAASINSSTFTGGCGYGWSLFLDHTGSTLYSLEADANQCANNAYQFFSIGATGELTYRGVTAVSTDEFETPLSFSANNEYAYSSSSYRYDPNVFGFKRSSNGDLTYLGINAEIPNPASGSTYEPYAAAADPSNHLAVSLTPVSDDTQNTDGPAVLAVYTISGSGNLTTSSTRENMPSVAVGDLNDMNTSTSGKLLAVGGSKGLQVFHFNGGSPLTHYTGLLTTDEIDQIHWDHDNHLYALSKEHGKLFVFTVTPTSVSQAAGSPYSVSGANSLIVVNLK